MGEQKKILCVGLVCLDIINVVDKYPEEDTDSRLACGLMLSLPADRASGTGLFVIIKTFQSSSMKHLLFK